MVLLVFISNTLLAQQSTDHSKHRVAQQQSAINCESITMACAKTISSVVGKNGRIWSAWSYQQHLYLNYSDDIGRSYSAPEQVNAIAEKISTRGENRPKIAIDDLGNVYLSWVTPLSKRFTSNVRFSYRDGSTKLFSIPVTVNNDNLLTGHSFNDMVVTPAGDVYIAWLDGRAKVAAAKKGIRLRSSELYLAHANFTAGKNTFDNNYLAQGTCVCCRLAMDLDQQGLPMLMWRHIFGDNFRDHGLLTMKNQTQANPMKRVSFENWQVDGCPHQGPTMIQDQQINNRTHMAWFNNAPQASGLFYSYSDNQGTTMQKVIHIAKTMANPEHPFLSQNISTNSKLELVWREYNGNTFEIKHQSSTTGDTWNDPKVIATSSLSVDYPYILQHPSSSYLQWHIVGKPLRLIKL